jgi:hypothetical protein
MLARIDSTEVLIYPAVNLGRIECRSPVRARQPPKLERHNLCELAVYAALQDRRAELLIYEDGGFLLPDGARKSPLEPLVNHPLAKRTKNLWHAS